MLITPRFLNTRDAATYLAIPARTLEYWRREGKGPAYIQLGAHTIRYAVAELDAFMKRARVLTIDAAAAQECR